MWVADFSATDSTFDRSSISGEMLTITLNRSQVLGSRIGDENTHIKIKNSVLDGSGYEGGPVWCGGGVTLTDSVVRDFVQPIYAYNFCTLDVVGSTFTNLPNGAIVGELADRTHRVSGSTFRQSGVAVQGSSLEITNSTFARNTTGVLVDDPAGSSLTGNVVRDNTEQGIYTTGNGPDPAKQHGRPQRGVRDPRSRRERPGWQRGPQQRSRQLRRTDLQHPLTAPTSTCDAASGTSGRGVVRCQGLQCPASHFSDPPTPTRSSMRTASEVSPRPVRASDSPQRTLPDDPSQLANADHTSAGTGTCVFEAAMTPTGAAKAPSTAKAATNQVGTSYWGRAENAAIAAVLANDSRPYTR